MDSSPHYSHLPASVQLKRHTHRAVILLLSVVAFDSSLVVAPFAQTINHRKYVAKIYPSNPPARARKSAVSVTNHSSQGISFSSLASDGKGGVWIGGQALFSGLLLHATPSVKPGTSPDLQKINDVSFPAPDLGWMIADGALFSSENQTHWIKVNVGEENALKKVYFLNERLGWVGDAAGVIYRTYDAGQHWQKQSSATGYEIRQIQFANALDGWALGAKYKIGYESRIFLATRDGGEHWTRIPRGESAPVGKFCFINEIEGWAVDYDNNIVHTTDRGWHWEQQRSGENSSFVSVFFVNSTEGWAAGDGILHTSDGGMTWRYQIEPGNLQGKSSFDLIYFSDPKHGWALDFFHVVFTTDGGKTWQPLDESWQNRTFEKAVKEQEDRLKTSNRQD